MPTEGWVVFLAFGSDGNWHSKFRQAHPFPYLTSESRHGWKQWQNLSSTTWPLSPALDLEKAMQKGRFNFSNWAYMICDEQLWDHLPAQGARWPAQKLYLLLSVCPSGSSLVCWGSHGLLSLWDALHLYPGGAGSWFPCTLWHLV